MGNDVNFLKLVQNHEREWGTDTYPNRPELAEIITSPVVLFWQPVPKDKQEAKLVNTRMYIRLHNDLAAVENYLSNLVLRSSVQLPERKLAYIFLNQKHLRVTGIQVTFEEM